MSHERKDAAEIEQL